MKRRNFLSGLLALPFMAACASKFGFARGGIVPNPDPAPVLMPGNEPFPPWGIDHVYIYQPALATLPDEITPHMKQLYGISPLEQHLKRIIIQANIKGYNRNV